MQPWRKTTKEDEVRPIIIIKKVKKVAGGHHGGAWKVAYADFVTAMMAFFLLLWLLNVVTAHGAADRSRTISIRRPAKSPTPRAAPAD